MFFFFPKVLLMFFCFSHLLSPSGSHKGDEAMCRCGGQGLTKKPSYPVVVVRCFVFASFSRQEADL